MHLNAYCTYHAPCIYYICYLCTVVYFVEITIHINFRIHRLKLLFLNNRTYLSRYKILIMCAQVYSLQLGYDLSALVKKLATISFASTNFFWSSFWACVVCILATAQVGVVNDARCVITNRILALLHILYGKGRRWKNLLV